MCQWIYTSSQVRNCHICIAYRLVRLIRCRCWPFQSKWCWYRAVFFFARAAAMPSILSGVVMRARVERTRKLSGQGSRFAKPDNFAPHELNRNIYKRKMKYLLVQDEQKSESHANCVIPRFRFSLWPHGIVRSVRFVRLCFFVLVSLCVRVCVCGAKCRFVARFCLSDTQTQFENQARRCECN